MKVICAGRISYDRTILLDSYPKENSKIAYKTINESCGGAVSNAAFLLSKWNENVNLIGKIGNDIYARRIRKDLLLNQIDNKYVFQDDETYTPLTDIIVNLENGTKTYLRYNIDSKIDDLILDDSPDIIYMDGLENKICDKFIDMYPRAVKVISPDRDTAEIVSLCKKSDYIIAPISFAESVTGVDIDFDSKRTLAEAYSKLNEMFNGTVIITAGEFGSIYKFNNQIRIMPSIKVKTIDPSGSGDIYRGAFIYCLIRKFDLEKSLKFSSVAGALSVTRNGEYTSIPTLEEMMEIYNEVK